MFHSKKQSLILCLVALVFAENMWFLAMISLDINPLPPKGGDVAGTGKEVDCKISETSAFLCVKFTLTQNVLWLLIMICLKKNEKQREPNVRLVNITIHRPAGQEEVNIPNNLGTNPMNVNGIPKRFENIPTWVTSL